MSGPNGVDTEDREALRATLSALDAREKKVVGGVIAIMIENPTRVRDREWIAEQFAEVALLAAEFEDVAGVHDGRDRLQAYVRAHIDPLLNACYRLFQLVAEDLQPRLAEGLSRDQAVAHALTYLAERGG